MSQPQQQANPSSSKDDPVESEEQVQMRKTFMDCQSRLLDLRRQLSNCQQQIVTRDRASRMADMTVKELDALESQESKSPLVTYRAIGKMFMRMEPTEIRSQMTQRAEKDRRDVQVLQRTREYLESSLNDQERSLRELLSQLQLVK